MAESVLDNFELPQHLEFAREDVAKMGTAVENVGDGVDIISGHKDGLAYRFLIHAEYNPKKSLESGFEEFDEMECIQFYVSRRLQPVLRLQELTPDKLRFNLRGEIVGGAYFDAYKRWKAGQKVPGLSIDKWGVCSPAVVRTFESEGIFTVEQLAEREESWVRQVFKNRDEFIEAFQRACQHVASRDAEIKSKAEAEKLMEVLRENKEMKQRLEALEARGSEAINKLKDPEKPKKRRGRPPKQKGEGE